MAIHSKDVLREFHTAERGVRRVNRRVGVAITSAVATMWCAYLFAALALISLPAALHASFSNGFQPLPIVTWVAQTFLQLVLLSVILFGQDLQSEKADARAEATFRNTTAAEQRLAESSTASRSAARRTRGWRPRTTSPAPARGAWC